MSDLTEIFVSLLNEGVDVRRPVQAEHLQGDIYRIIMQSYDPEVETWQFKPGDEVICEVIDAGGDKVLAATRLCNT